MQDTHDRRSDEELVEGYLDGDVAAFRTLIERYHDALLRFLTRLMGSRQSAEDVFQETFLQVHQSLESFDTSRSFRPWLFTIGANKGRDALRRSQRRATVSLSAPMKGDHGTSFVDLMEIDLPGPSEPLESKEQAAMVQHAIDQMPPRQREILLMAYFQKLTYAQIADAFEIPIGTVKSRLHAAVASFARRWQEQIDQRRDNQSSKETSAGNGEH